MIKREEILEELEHYQALNKALRKRLYALELQKAQHGNSTPPHVITEIVSLAEESRQSQKVIRELKSALGEEDELILTELRYKQALLNTWSLRSSHSRPLLRDITDLDIQRRRLGLTVERAKQLEIETRTALTDEVFYNMDASHSYWIARSFGYDKDRQDFIDDIPDSIKAYLDEEIVLMIKYKGSDINRQLEYIGIGIRLNPERTLELLVSMIPKNIPLNVTIFEFLMNKVNKTWIFQEDKEIFSKFFLDLKEYLIKNQYTLLE